MKFYLYVQMLMLLLGLAVRGGKSAVVTRQPLNEL